MYGNGWKSTEIGGNVRKRVEMDRNWWNWTEPGGNELKRLEMNETRRKNK